MSSLTAPAHVPIRSFHVPIRSGTPAGLGPRRAPGAGRRALGEKATPILYVPSRADQVPMRSFKDYEKGSGISIRSFTFRRSSDAFCQVYAKKVSLVLYVPIRSDKVPTRSSKFYKKGFRNSIRSYTFR